MCETTFTLTTAGGFSDGVTSSQSLAMTFSLDGVQFYLGANASIFQSLSPAELSTLFDHYRLDGIEIQVLASGDPNTFTATGTLPRMYIFNDYDDSGTVGNLAQAQQSQGVQVFQPGALDRSFSHFIKPRLLTQTYRTAVTTGYAPAEKSIWVDSAQGDVPHYGVKLWATLPGVAASVTFVIRSFLS